MILRALSILEEWVGKYKINFICLKISTEKYEQFYAYQGEVSEPSAPPPSKIRFFLMKELCDIFVPQWRFLSSSLL